MNVKYCVDVWESERGWGRNLIESLFFDTKDAAVKYANDVNSKNTEDVVPDYYIYATDPYLVDLDDKK